MLTNVLLLVCSGLALFIGVLLLMTRSAGDFGGQLLSGLTQGLIKYEKPGRPWLASAFFVGAAVTLAAGAYRIAVALN